MSRLSSFDQDLAGTAQDLTVSGFAYNPASQIGALTRSNDTYAWGGHYNANRNYAVNGLNQMTAAGTTSLGYDGRGNLTSSGSSIYSYNALNQMTAGPAPGSFLPYDPAGRLNQIYTESLALIYDGPNLISENVNAATVIARRYVYGPGEDEPLVWYEGSGTADRRWLHADERGSVIAVTNASGNAIAINSYDEYGIPASANIGRFQYTGQAWLPELGMYYYKARMYSPTLGRFMQTDPIGYADGINWYNYVGSDPVNFIDPTGLFGADGIIATACSGNPIVNGRCVNVLDLFGGGSSSGGSGTPSGGTGGLTPAKPNVEPPGEEKEREPNCDTKLPDGRTIGQIVNSVVSIIENKSDQQLGAFIAAAEPNGPLDFKNNYRGRGNAAFLGAAGNFAYGAVARRTVGLFIGKIGAGAYGISTATFGSRRFSDLRAPYGMDSSASNNIDRGASSVCGKR